MSERARGHTTPSSSSSSKQDDKQSTPLRPTSYQSQDEPQFASDTTSSGIPSPGSPSEEQKPSAKTAASSEGSTLASEDDSINKPRQTIAVSASRGPAAFFNLARKFLVTDEMCDLSALEGAIVSAVDAAHLLERSKLATIVRVQTSYVTVEPKRRKQQPTGSAARGGSSESPSPTPAAPAAPATAASSSATPPPEIASADQAAQGIPPRQRASVSSGGGRELRRARIVITVKRTESYERWLEENPLQAIIAGDGDDDEEAGSAAD